MLIIQERFFSLIILGKSRKECMCAALQSGDSVRSEWPQSHCISLITVLRFLSDIVELEEDSECPGLEVKGEMSLTGSWLYRPFHLGLQHVLVEPQGYHLVVCFVGFFFFPAARI